MTDHYPRIRAQQETEAELAAIAELEQRTAPLLWMVYAAAFAAVLLIAADGWKNYKDTAAYYARLEEQHEKLVQCINGRALLPGDAVMRCQVTNYKLVKGLK